MYPHVQRGDEDKVWWQPHPTKHDITDGFIFILELNLGRHSHQGRMGTKEKSFYFGIKFKPLG